MWLLYFVNFLSVYSKQLLDGFTMTLSIILSTSCDSSNTRKWSTAKKSQIKKIHKVVQFTLPCLFFYSLYWCIPQLLNQLHGKLPVVYSKTIVGVCFYQINMAKIAVILVLVALTVMASAYSLRRRSL